jgi:hypothetical protein
MVQFAGQPPAPVMAASQASGFHQDLVQMLDVEVLEGSTSFEVPDEDSPDRVRHEGRKPGHRGQRRDRIDERQR